MITIQYKPVILNGIDKTGMVETIEDAQALALIELGYASIFKTVEQFVGFFS